MSEPGPLCVYEKRDPHIAIIRLNRPEKKNSISRDLYWALDEAWQKAKDDDDVWSIILTGTADCLLRRRRSKRKSRLRQRRDDRPALRAAAVFEHAHAADAQADHRRDQRLCRRRRFWLGARLPYPLLRAGSEIRLRRSALVAYGGMAKLYMPDSRRDGAIGLRSPASWSTLIPRFAWDSCRRSASPTN